MNKISSINNAFKEIYADNVKDLIPPNVQLFGFNFKEMSIERLKIYVKNTNDPEAKRILKIRTSKLYEAINSPKRSEDG